MTDDGTAEVTRQDMETWMEGSPFIKFLGLTLESFDSEKGEAAMKMPLRPEFERGGGITGQFHGGPVAALIDTVGDFAVAAMVKGGVPTINFRIDYLRPSTGSWLLGSAVARRVGRTVGVVDIDVHDDKGRLTAIGRGCYGTRTG